MLKVNSALLAKVYSPIFDALNQNDLEKLKQIFTAPSSSPSTLISTPNYLGLLPIHVAADTCPLPIVEYLITSAGATNAITRGTNWCALHYAVKSSKLAKVQYLCSAAVNFLPIGKMATLDCLQLAMKHLKKQRHYDDDDEEEEEEDESRTILKFLIAKFVSSEENGDDNGNDDDNDNTKITMCEIFETCLKDNSSNALEFLMNKKQLLYTPHIGYQVITKFLEQHKQHRFDVFLKAGISSSSSSTTASEAANTTTTTSEDLLSLLRLAIEKSAPVTVDSLLDYYSDNEDEAQIAINELVLRCFGSKQKSKSSSGFGFAAPSLASAMASASTSQQQDNEEAKQKSQIEVLQVLLAHGIKLPVQLLLKQCSSDEDNEISCNNNSNLLKKFYTSLRIVELQVKLDEQQALLPLKHKHYMIDSVATVARIVSKNILEIQQQQENQQGNNKSTVQQPSNYVAVIVECATGIKDIPLTLTSNYVTEVNSKNSNNGADKILPSMLIVDEESAAVAVPQVIKVQCKLRSAASNQASNGFNSSAAAQLLGFGGDNVPDIVFQFRDGKQ